MPEVLTGCPIGGGRGQDDTEHCYCGIDNMCCYCRMPIEEARMRQEPSLTRTAEQYRARYTSPRYTQANWFIDESAPIATTNTITWGNTTTTTTTSIAGQTISWTPISNANEELLENLIFTPLTDDDGSEEVKD